MKRKKILPFTIIAAFTVLALVYGIAQKNQLVLTAKKEMVKPTEIKDIDTFNLGVPTNDDPWQEMENLVKGYYEKQGITYQGTMRLIDDNGDDEKVLEEKPFEFTLLNDSYYYSIGAMEVVNKKEYVIAIDNENKSIALSPKAGAVKNKTGFFSIEEFKKMMADRKASAKVTQLGNVKVLTIDNIEDPSIQGYSIYYFPQTYRIKKMLIGMARLSPLEDDENPDENISDKTPGNKKIIASQSSKTADDGSVNEYDYYLEINYNDVKTLSIKDADFNPENKFLKITENKIGLTDAYKDYQLVSTLTGLKKSSK